MDVSDLTSLAPPVAPRAPGSQLRDVLLVGLPGPSHHFGALSPGNVASQAHGGQCSHPRAAALQCLDLMRVLLDLGQEVLLIPPLARPDNALLTACGFGTDPRGAVVRCAADSPRLLRWAWSSAAMWTANLGTVAPGLDSDGTTRLLIANLTATPHRTREAAPRCAQMRQLFASVPRLRIEDALPALGELGDEGAANHTRLRVSDDAPGIHLFVHGRSERIAAERLPQRFPARQTHAASQAAARRLQLPDPRCVHARQHPEAIDAGAFHHDVVSVGDRDRLLIHASALVNQERVLLQLRLLVPDLRIAQIGAEELALSDAISSYLFNSLLLDDVLVAPSQCGSGPAAAVIARLITDRFIRRAVLVDVRESMANGGGPACLRLRLPLDADQRAALPAGLRLTPARLVALAAWIEAHYRTDLHVSDLADPTLIDEHAAALTALAPLLDLPELP